MPVKTLQGFLRRILRRLLTGEGRMVLERRVPSLEDRLGSLEELGLYLHIPFCRQICPYCPYNKELYDPDLASKYVEAVSREIDFYARFLGDKPVTSFYVGGGTPTTMLYSGLGEILERIFGAFDMRCEIHMESHPNDLSRQNLEAIKGLGVQHLSMGVEALQDSHLRTLQRPYTVQEAKGAVERAIGAGFKCVNADLIFGLPNQTLTEVEQAGRELVELGVDQVAAYPLFTFPYTKMGREIPSVANGNSGVWQRRKMLQVLEEVFYGAGYARTSVWAFTRPEVPKYCSVTVPLYLGLGASAGSYLRDVFYLNTFKVSEYINSLEQGRVPIALSLELSERMQMAGWLYWRIYETRFSKADFHRRFGRELDSVFGKYLRPLSWAGLLHDDGEEVVLSDEGTYWLHVLEDLFSIDYVGRLWGLSQREPWPERVVL
ncbi:MAG: coproporphyrinogen III oxidase family protein [Anaerolineae bacterium]|nr:coproporphyrinogen III oxidase family protein [Anaerolineae bacterium]